MGACSCAASPAARPARSSKQSAWPGPTCSRRDTGTRPCRGASRGRDPCSTSSWAPSASWRSLARQPGARPSQSTELWTAEKCPACGSGSSCGSPATTAAASASRASPAPASSTRSSMPWRLPDERPLRGARRPRRRRSDRQRRRAGRKHVGATDMDPGGPRACTRRWQLGRAARAASPRGRSLPLYRDACTA